MLGDTQPSPFLLIGVDGGRMEYSVERWTIVLGPGERADVLVAPRVGAGGLELINVPFNRGFGSVEFRSSEDLITFEAAPLPAVPKAEFPNLTHDIPAMTPEGATPISITLGSRARAGRRAPAWRRKGDKQPKMRSVMSSASRPAIVYDESV